MLTKSQEKVLREIEKYIEVNKIAPTVRELGELTGLKSTSTVQGYINRLEKNGYIKRHPTCPRTITILKGTKPTFEERTERFKKLVEILEMLGL